MHKYLTERKSGRVRISRAPVSAPGEIHCVRFEMLDVWIHTFVYKNQETIPYRGKGNGGTVLRRGGHSVSVTSLHEGP